MKNSLLLLSLLVLVACSSQKYAESSARLYSEASTNDKLLSESDLGGIVPERKIIQNAWLTLIVRQVDSTRNQIQALATTYHGYVEQGELEQITLRLPAENLDAALAQIESFGKVENRSIRTQDVTDQYFDLDSRIQSLEKTRQRYLQLLEQATNVSEILAVEKELERTTQELEALQGRFKRLDDQVAYASISVSLREKVKPGPLGYIGVGLYHVVKWLFVRN